MKTEAVLFDFGGTIDTGGYHWYEKFWKLYSDTGIVIDRTVFRDAFSYSEKQMHLHDARNLNFSETYYLKISFQIQYLKKLGMLSYIEDIEQFSKNFAKLCKTEVETHISSIKDLLHTLHSVYRMAIISNYYGNLELICKNFRIDKYFDAITDSGAVGVRKPNSQIFSLTLSKLNICPEDSFMIGDSYEKDILPAHQSGCKTIWLRNKAWKNSEDHDSADYIITKLSDVKDILLSNK